MKFEEFTDETDNEFKELLLKAKNGDQKALTKIIKKYKYVIFNNCYIDGRLDEDCCQDLTIKFIDYLKKFKID